MSLRSKLPVALLLIAGFIGGIFFVTSAGNLLGLDRLLGNNARAQQDLSVSANIRTAEDLGNAFAEVAEAVNPAVVQVSSTMASPNRRQGPGQEGPNPFEGTPFEDFFRFGPGDQMPQQPRTGLGSGAVIRPDGYIVTNDHVIRNADQLEVRFFDGTRYEATVVGSDPDSDLAILKVEANNLPYLSFGDSSQLRVGQWVLAFGSPFDADLGNTVTSGIVSALGRPQQLTLLADFIQTDAAINPGNSGGPLVNLRGEIVGINTAIFSRTGGFQGIGFAIPSLIAQNTVDQLIDTGEVSRGFLGIQPQGISRSLAQNLGVQPGAAQVANVTPGSAAARAGLQEGDVITAIDGRTLRDSREVFAQIGNRRPGDRVQLTVMGSNRRERNVTVTLDRREEQADATPTPRPNGAPEPPNGAEMQMESLGLTLQPLTQNTRRSFRIAPEVNGVVVSNVETASAAYREADLRQGDVIVEANRQAVSSPAEFQRFYNGISSGESFLIRVVRSGQGGQTVSFLTALTKP